MGRDALGHFEDQATFELTDVGRYLLGMTEAFTWPDAAESTSVVVQPDFEIVFFAANPSLEASIIRFAERIGKGIGVLFRLTRQSIQGATRSGLSGDEILASLNGVCSVPVPDNVAREIAGWCEQAVQLCWEPAQLVRCPDEETAARVLSAARGKLVALTPTVLALTDVKQRAAITNACRKAGVFLDLPRSPLARRSAGGGAARAGSRYSRGRIVVYRLSAGPRSASPYLSSEGASTCTNATEARGRISRRSHARVE